MHTTTLAYYRDDEMYLVVGSNWGKENHPGWYYNLMEHPRTTIQVASKLITVEARPAQGDDYQRLWQMVCKQNDQYIHYQKMIKRRIPVVVLVPIKPS